jgi:hypothetical protein
MSPSSATCTMMRSGSGSRLSAPITTCTNSRLGSIGRRPEPTHHQWTVERLSIDGQHHRGLRHRGRSAPSRSSGAGDATANSQQVLDSEARMAWWGLEDAGRLRSELRAFLRIEGDPAVPSLDLVSSDPEDGFTRQRVHLVVNGDTIPAFVAVPTGDGPFPGVVAFHQHAGQRHLGKSEGVRTRRRPVPGLCAAAGPGRVRRTRP